MLRSILIGLVAGQRAMPPRAALAVAARGGALPQDNGPARLMAHPLIGAGGIALAAAEMAGDKMKTAPDRTVFPGLLARSVTSGFAGATLARPGRERTGAAIGIATAIGAAYLGLALRKRTMRRWGQTPTGLAEDAISLMAALAVTNARQALGR